MSKRRPTAGGEYESGDGGSHGHPHRDHRHGRRDRTHWEGEHSAN